MRGLLLALVVVACGDDATTANPDGPPAHDAPSIDAPMPDAAPPDAPACASTVWMLETLEPAGASPSMVIDDQGAMHVAFIKGQFTGELWYGQRTPGGVWASERVYAGTAVDSTAIAADASGGVHIVFQTSPPDAFQYAFKPAGGTWGIEVVHTPVNIGAYQIVSIALDAAGKPHLGLEYDDTQIEMVHAHKENDVWMLDVAEGTGSAAPFSGPRIAVDGSTIKMAYPVVNSQSRFAVEQNGSWSILDVSANPGDVSLALDGAGTPHLTYDLYSGSMAHLAYATPAQGGGWTVETAADPGQAPGQCNFRCGVSYMNWLVLDSAGGAHASFAEFESLDSADSMYQDLVRYAYRAPGGGWTNEYIDGVGAYAGIYNEIALDPAGGVHVVYTYMTTSNGTPALKHAYRCR